MKAKCTEVFSECTYWENGEEHKSGCHYGDMRDCVIVEAHMWEAFRRRCLVARVSTIRTAVKIDGEWMFDNAVVFDSHLTHEVIREAILRMDAHVSLHPAHMMVVAREAAK